MHLGDDRHRHAQRRAQPGQVGVAGLPLTTVAQIKGGGGEGNPHAQPGVRIAPEPEHDYFRKSGTSSSSSSGDGRDAGCRSAGRDASGAGRPGLGVVVGPDVAGTPGAGG